MDSLITHILFELQPIMVFSPVANFGHHPLCTCNRPKLQCKVRSANIFGSRVSHLKNVRIRFVGGLKSEGTGGFLHLKCK